MERGTKLTAQPSNAGEPPVRRKLQDGVLVIVDVNEHDNTNDDSNNWRSEDNYGELPRWQPVNWHSVVVRSRLDEKVQFAGSRLKRAKTGTG
jgi:hypothetical protein